MSKKLFPRQDWVQIAEENQLAKLVRVQAAIRGFLARTSQGRVCKPGVNGGQDAAESEENAQAPEAAAAARADGHEDTALQPFDAARMESLERLVHTLNKNVNRLLEVCQAGGGVGEGARQRVASHE